VDEQPHSKHVHVVCGWTQIRKIASVCKKANEFQNCPQGPRSRQSFLSDMLPCKGRETSYLEKQNHLSPHQESSRQRTVGVAINDFVFRGRRSPYLYMEACR
jgi:hypothetical protein